jgi:HAD superfamily hydrolase (TIGR01490 family)
MVAYGPALQAAGLITRRLVARAVWTNVVHKALPASEARMQHIQELGLRIIRGWDAALVGAIIRDHLDDLVAPIVYTGAQERIHAHAAAGDRVFIVSSAPEEIVVPVAQHLGAHEAIASRAAVDDRGRYTGTADRWNFGPMKPALMREAAARLGVDLADCFAYSDAHTDLPMLESVGHPNPVNPDRTLARIAASRGWTVHRFRTTAGAGRRLLAGV